MMTLDQSSTTMMICYLLKEDCKYRRYYCNDLEETGQQVQYTITTDTTTETSTQVNTAITTDSGASNLFDVTFYVMNSTYDVYKCIDNNGGASFNSRINW